MSGYTKLFGSILASTVWELPLATKVVWITMLAMSDRNGEVQASVPGLAKFAGVTIQQCEQALMAFLLPDRYSRTKEHDGRRVEEIDGGWRLLNHGKYREQMSADLQRERDAARKAKYREGQKRDKAGHFGTVPASPDIAEAAPAPAPEAKTDQNTPAPRARVSSGRSESEAFKEFYSAFPRHVGRDKAWGAWRSRGCEPIAAEIMAAVAWQSAKVFAGCPIDKVPHPASWLNAGRWKDEQPRQTTIARPARPSGPPVAIAEEMGQRALKLAAQSELERLAKAEEFRRERERDSGGIS